MNFKDFLFRSYTVWQKPPKNFDISSVCSHSSKVRKDSLFIALKGKNTDGHRYLKSVTERGASALLVEESDSIPPQFKGLVLLYKEPFLSRLLNEFYDFPSEKLFTVGITGTNGKTSFCRLLWHLFESCGWPSAVMGTLGHHFKDKTWPALLTTPGPSELFERLSDFVRLSARALAMEVSSIAVDQNRVAGVDFNALVFSNLSQDHLDYHQTIEKYFLAKQKLFIQAELNPQKNLFYLLNQDDIYSHKIKKVLKKPCWTFGKSDRADFRFKIKTEERDKTVFELQSPGQKTEFYSPLKGEHNVYNAVSAIACVVLTGFKMEDCQKALADFPGIPSRLEKLPCGYRFEVFIDYAHSPQALSFVLKTLRKEYGFLILVFGCGGDRDKQKRAPMMKIALEYADHIFLTTDNPRYEDPEKITQDMLKGQAMTGQVTEELDRAEAVKKALELAELQAGGKKNVCVLIAGKGHETFQIIKGKKIPFSDKQIALKLLRE